MYIKFQQFKSNGYWLIDDDVDDDDDDGDRSVAQRHSLTVRDSYGFDLFNWLWRKVTVCATLDSLCLSCYKRDKAWRQKTINLKQLLYVFTILNCYSVLRKKNTYKKTYKKLREPNIKTLCSPLSAEFWRHYVLSGALPRHHREEMKT